jgi:23S rRNA (cytosine1962-C5)-methyltransferase
MTAADDYQLLDSGDGEKLERFGEMILRRKVPSALWSRSLAPSIWDEYHALHIGSGENEGRWECRLPLPDHWWVRYAGLNFLLRPNPFGHLGLFPEQADNWQWLRVHVRPASRVLNLFAYTGGSSLAAATAGGRVTHVDAVRGVVAWAAENAKAVDLTTIRWIVDDAAAFAARELRRGRRYDTIVVDPPTFGRGPKGQLWKIEDHLPTLMRTCRRLLSDNPDLFLLSAHTPGLSPLVLENLLREHVGDLPGEIESGEMVVPGPRPLPSGVFARWRCA